VDLTVTFGREPSAAGRRAPLSLAVGAWLLQRAGWSGPVEGLAVGSDADVVGAGKELRDVTIDYGLLVVGDGSARLTTSSPGYVDPSALAWQQQVDAAFRRGDAQYLLELDQALATQVMASGGGPWQGAAASLGEADITVATCAADDRYGVGYVAAAWIPA
jgi:hypothetical protein